MAEINILEEANKQVHQWREKLTQSERDFTYVSGKIDGLSEFISMLQQESSNAEDHADGDTVEASAEPVPDQKTAAK
jgi:hypothetical protein